MPDKKNEPVMHGQQPVSHGCSVMPEKAARHGPRRVRLAQFTTLGVGGECELWVCHNEQELKEATTAPYRILGGGSNLIVSDDGVVERVIKLGGDFSATNLENTSTKNGEYITDWVGAAKGIPGLLRQLQKLGLSGLEGLVGVPAVVGGCVCMNAGTSFGWISHALERVEIFVDGRSKEFAPEELDFEYRNSRIPPSKFGPGIVTRVKLRLTRSTPAMVQEKMNAADQARKGQPHERTFGCAFKNPAGNSAGRLIDQAGLKGLRVGGAMISDEHANFLVNTGGATAKDVLTLLKQIEEKLSIKLEREVEVWSSNSN